MGTSNLAARRGAKANRRKAIVAEKRKAEAVGGSLAGRVALASRMPIRECLLTADLFKTGMGTLTLVRGSRFGDATMGVFLVDTFCRGVKDVMLRTLEAEVLDKYLDRLDEAGALDDVDPSYARKLLCKVASWSTSLGFPPHRDFPVVEKLFGDVDADVCKTDFHFGSNGKPLYVSGPHDSPSTSRRHIEQLSGRLGPDGFHYIVPW